MERTTAAKVSSFMDIIKKLVLFITCRKMARLYLTIQKCLQNCSENDSLKFKSIILCFYFLDGNVIYLSVSVLFR